MAVQGLLADIPTDDWRGSDHIDDSTQYAEINHYHVGNFNFMTFDNVPYKMSSFFFTSKAKHELVIHV